MNAQTMPDHIKQLVKDQLKSAVKTFAFDGTNVRPIQPTVMPKTILKRLFGLDEVALLHAGKCPELMDWETWKNALEFYLGRGIEHEGQTYSIIGGSSSMKSGMFWLGTKDMKERAHRYFSSSQEALTYWGILISGNHQGIYDLDVDILLVDDHEFDTGDGMGFISLALLQKLELPSKQMQVRLVTNSWLGKGTLHPMPVDPLFPDVDLILPKSMIKGKGKPASGKQKVTLGIRDIAQQRPYNSNFTYAQWFDSATLEALYPVVDQKLQKTQAALLSNQAALDFLHLNVDEMQDGRPCEARSKLEAFLQAGLSPTHPWIHRHLKELVRRQHVTLAMGGGIELTGYMGAHANLDDGTVCIKDLPEGPIVLSRYPIRDPHSLQAVWNKPDVVPYAAPGSVYLSEELAKQVDGDFDGDYYIVNTQEPVVSAVWDLAWGEGLHRIPGQAKKRRSDSLEVLPYVAVEGLGNSIGYITYLISASVLAGQTEFVSELSASLQDEVQSLKWSTHADRGLFDKVEMKVAIPTFLSDGKSDRDLFSKRADKLEGDHPLIANYNHVVDLWKGSRDLQEPLINFKPQIPLWVDPQSLDCIEEASVVLNVYNRWIGKIIAEKNGNPLTEDLLAPISFLESWGQTKDDKQAWAVALWNVVHGTRNENSGSAVFHAFPEETIKLVAKRHDRPVAIMTSQKQGSRQDVWTIPVVGGHYFQKSEKPHEDFQQQVAKLGSDCNVITVEVNNQVALTCEGVILGVIPKDNLLFGAIPANHTFSAKLVLRANVVWLLTAKLF